MFRLQELSKLSQVSKSWAHLRISEETYLKDIQNLFVFFILTFGKTTYVRNAILEGQASSICVESKYYKPRGFLM